MDTSSLPGPWAKRGSLRVHSRSVARKKAAHSGSVVCENCIQRPSADNPTINRIMIAELGARRSTSHGGAAAKAWSCRAIRT